MILHTVVLVNFILQRDFAGNDPLRCFAIPTADDIIAENGKHRVDMYGYWNQGAVLIEINSYVNAADAVTPSFRKSRSLNETAAKEYELTHAPTWICRSG